MTQATLAEPDRRGETTVNRLLDYIVAKTAPWTTDKLTDRLMRDGVIGTPDSTDNGPVGLWVADQLQAVGLPVASYTWVVNLAVYDSRRVLLGEVDVPESHVMWDLDCEINDGMRPELCDQGEGDQR